MLLFAAACGSDDTPEPDTADDTVQTTDDTDGTDDDQGLPPSDFTIEVTPSFFAASLTWNQPEGANNIGILYDVYLNDEVVAEGLEVGQRQLEMENLEMNSTYTVRIEARNEDGRTNSITEFTTLDIADYSVEIDYIDYYYPGGLGFTERFHRCHDSDLICRISSYDVSKRYEYDPIGRVIDIVISFDFSGGYSGSFTYEDDRIATGYLRFYDDGYEYYELDVDYATPESFKAVHTDRDPVTLEIVSQTNYNINVTLDGQDRVVFFERANLEDGSVETLAFEYEEGNLTKMIINGEEPGLLFEYDDSPNMYAVAPAVPFVGRRDLSISNELSRNLIYLPQMMNFRNANNPVRKWSNGSLVQEWEYTYNEFGYIHTIRNPDATEGIYQQAFYVFE